MTANLRDWNLNTILQVVSLAAIVFGGGKMWADSNAADREQDKAIVSQETELKEISTALRADLAVIGSSLAVLTKETTDFAAWRSAHEKTSVDRRGSVEGNLANMFAQVRDLDARLDKAEVQIDRSLQSVVALDRLTQSSATDLGGIRQEISELSGRVGIAIAFIEELRTDRLNASRPSDRRQ